MSDIKWLAPNNVKTPNIETDIEKYLCKELRDEYEKGDSNYKEKIEVLTERLEFIEHLNSIKDFIRQNSTHKKIVDETGNNNEEEKHLKYKLECSFLNKDFAGVDFDIEALILYLLVTCIDTIKSTPKPSGYKRNFRNAFKKDLDSNIQNELIDNLIVVRLEEVEYEDDNSMNKRIKTQINTESLKEWNKKTKEAKLVKIVNTLYDFRSNYTHKSVRSFIPNEHLEIVAGLIGTHLLCNEDVCFIDLMIKVIKSIAKKNFCEEMKWDET